MTRKRASRRAAIVASLVAVPLMLVLLAKGCLLHWPDAPRTDTAPRLSEDLEEQLLRAHPGAKLTSVVYRRHMEQRFGGYRVVSRTFYFEDAAGTPFRGFVGADGKLSTLRIERLQELPEELHDLFFQRYSHEAEGAELAGPVRRFRSERTGQAAYEFEIEKKHRRGLGFVAGDGKRTRLEWLSRDDPR